MTLRNAQAAGCGCRLHDTGVDGVRMRDISRTTAHTVGKR